MANNRYCSTYFKTGEELDAALAKALECNDNAARAEGAQTAAEVARMGAEEARTAAKESQTGAEAAQTGAEAAQTAAGEYAARAEEAAERAEQSGTVDPELEGRVETLEQNAQVFIGELEALKAAGQTIQETTSLLYEGMLGLSLRVNTLEQTETLPEVTDADNNKILKVVDGSWALVAMASLAEDMSF
jgi:hypothetical protein